MLRQLINEKKDKAMLQYLYVSKELSIVECAEFFVSGPTTIRKLFDFKRCWALRNLQLLPAKDNLRKNAKIGKPFQPSLGISNE